MAKIIYALLGLYACTTIAAPVYQGALVQVSCYSDLSRVRGHSTNVPKTFDYHSDPFAAHDKTNTISRTNTAKQDRGKDVKVGVSFQVAKPDKNVNRQDDKNDIHKFDPYRGQILAEVAGTPLDALAVSDRSVPSAV